MKTLLTLALALSIPAVSHAAPYRSAPTLGNRTVNVTPANRAQYGHLSAWSASLNARLTSYDNRASTPTSSRAVYNSLVQQKASLAVEVNRYNAAVNNLANGSTR